MTRGSSLSDPTVMKEINDHFVAIEHNITDHGWPEEVPALDAWKRAYESKWLFKRAFATSVVLTADGKLALGSSGSGYQAHYKTSINYHADLYLSFLKGSRARDLQLREIDTDTEAGALTKGLRRAEVKLEAQKAIKDANTQK